jgi:hypothetical protein
MGKYKFAVYCLVYGQNERGYDHSIYRYVHYGDKRSPSSARYHEKNCVLPNIDTCMPRTLIARVPQHVASPDWFQARDIVSKLDGMTRRGRKTDEWPVIDHPVIEAATKKRRK